MSLNGGSGTRMLNRAQMLQVAAGHVGQGRLAEAEQLLNPLLAARPERADVLYLMAVIRLMQLRMADAEPLLRRSLALDPHQPRAALNLGVIVRGLGRIDEAAGWFENAVASCPGYADAHFNLGLVHQERGEFAAAEVQLRLAVQHAPDLLEAHTALGGLLIRLGRAEEAERVLSAAQGSARTPLQQASVKNAMSRARRAQADLSGALSHLEAAHKLAPTLPNLAYARGDVLQHMGRSEEALAAFRLAVTHNPMDLHAHRALNQLLFSLDRDQEFLRSYDEACPRAADPIRLHIAKASALLVADRIDEAIRGFESVLLRSPDDVDARYGLASALLRHQEFPRAISEFRRADADRPQDQNIRHGLIGALLQAGEPVTAARMAQARLREAPGDQTALALLGVAWRLCDDEREVALNGFEELIRVFEIEPPEGYGDMAAFNRDLDASLDALHPYAREFLEQSLRRGSQTFGDLFSERHELVGRLQRRIEAAISDYLCALRQDEAHPFLSRNRQQFRFAGSWSSRLRDRGFHINHIHPQGWISSCYYVAVPSVTEDVVAQQGWLKFGEPAYEVGLKTPVRRTIQPRPGTLVLFPSYLWHGTTSFHSEQARTTIAFDVVPVP
jgi:tetratricopeptide (TPR) repeat protein